MRKLRVLAAATATAVSIGVVGMTSPASADIGDDIPILLDNAPAATDALIDGLQTTIAVVTATQSAVDTSAALGNTLVAAGSALVAGTEQFGALSLGFLVINNSVQTAIEPVLGAIDDPSTAGEILTVDDINGVLANLGPSVNLLLHGNNENGLFSAVASLLRGQIAGEGLLNPGTFLGDGINGLGFFTTTIGAGTNVEGLTLPVVAAILVGAVAGGEYAIQLQDALGPVLETLAPILEPVAAVFDAL